jgi:type I restriction enzyme R subunit
MSLNESVVEDAALEWFGELGYAVGHGLHTAPGEPAAERDSFGEVVLVGRLRNTIRHLNPSIPEEAREDALRKVLRVGTLALIPTNRTFHTFIRNGVPVEYPRPDGSIAGDNVRLIDFSDVKANDWYLFKVAICDLKDRTRGSSERPDEGLIGSTGPWPSPSTAPSWRPPS